MMKFVQHSLNFWSLLFKKFIKQFTVEFGWPGFFSYFTLVFFRQPTRCNKIFEFQNKTQFLQRTK